MRHPLSTACLGACIAGIIGSPWGSLAYSQDCEQSFGSGFGSEATSLEADGELAVVGDPEWVLYENFGIVVPFERGPAGWQVLPPLYPLDPVSQHFFGYSVAIDGDTIVVGAIGDDEVAERAGAAYVFERAGGVWQQAAKLTASDGAFVDEFGLSVAISGDRVIVGTAEHGLAGASYVFVRDTGGWVEEAKLTPSDGASNDRFGSSVAISGDTALVGAIQHDGQQVDTGAAYWFEREPGGWVEVFKTVPSEAVFPWFFGSDVAIEGDRAVVGASAAQPPSGSGAAYVYERDGAGDWSLQARLRASDPESVARFGSNVDLLGDRIAVGAYSSDGVAQDSGAVYLFEGGGSLWRQLAKMRPLGVGWGSRFGAVLGLGDTFVLGAGGFGPSSDTTLVHELRIDCVLGSVGQPFCFGDGSAAPCPCANEAPTGSGEGCLNSTVRGARLVGQGSGGVAADDLLLVASQLAASQPVLAFSGTVQVNGGQGVAFGDGLRCAGNAVVRLGVRVAGADGATTYGPGLGAIGGWSAGEQRFFQVWSRDPAGSPCSAQFNLSSGLGVAFTP